MDAFDAAFGVSTGLGDDPQPMIDALRGQKRDGDFASLSTIGQISDFGKNQSQGALNTANRAGGLKLAREKEQRIKEQQEAAATLQHKRQFALQAARDKAAAERVKTQHDYTMTGKQFDVDNRAPKKTSFGEQKLYKDGQGNEFWLTQGTDGQTYRQSNIAGQGLTPVSLQGLTEIKNTGSKAADKNAITVYQQQDDGTWQGRRAFQQGGQLRGDGDEVFDSTWVTDKPPTGSKIDMSGDVQRLQTPDGERSAVKGKDGTWRDSVTSEVIEVGDGSGVKVLPDWETPSFKEKETAIDKVKSAVQLKGVLNSYDPSFSNEKGIPFLGTLQNEFTRLIPALANEEMKDQGSWWRNYSKFYDMLMKHDQIGSQQTRTEVRDWLKSNANADDTPERTQQFLGLMGNLLDEEMVQRRDLDVASNYPAEYIDTVYGRYFDGDADEAFKESVNRGTPTPAGNPPEAIAANPAELKKYLALSPEDRATIDAYYAGQQ